MDEFHFDGLRFDFTHPIHSQNGGGGNHGWELLRDITSSIKDRHPEAFLAAEEFPNHPILVTPTEQGGAGFDAMWNTEFQHRLIHDHGNPSVLQEASRGNYTRVDKFMGHLTDTPGFPDPSHSVTVVSNHDEVGNADRIIHVANQHRELPAGEWETSAARTALGVSLLSPGVPIFFQGTESLADNHFKWGIPSTWDVGWEWLEQPSSPRFKHHQFSKALIELRQSSPALEADVAANRVYTHELDSVMAFTRAEGDEEFLVVASLNRAPLDGYHLPLEGKWEPVLSSDDTAYGGTGERLGSTLGEGDSLLDIPAGGLLVFKRVDR